MVGPAPETGPIETPRAQDTSTSTRRRAGRWLAVGGVVVGIYATLPVGPAAWRSFRAAAGAVEPWTAALVGVAVGGAFLWTRRAALARLSAGRLALLAAVLGVYAWGFGNPALTPAEKTHFLYYGALAWVAHRALALDLAPPALELCTVVVAGAVGLGDEGIQYLLPRRFFEWKDVGLNVLAGGLVTVLIALVEEARR